MADVLIAGGGPAGSALAILLGRQGLRVELFERGRFPREKPCGEGLMPAGLAVLSRLGAADAVGGAPFFGILFHFGDQTIEGRFPQVAGFPVVGRGQRRKRLDQVLFQLAAETPGVSAFTGAQVEAPLIENSRVVGLRVNGELRRASLVVAADGVRSRLRRQLGLDLPPRRKRFGVRAHFRLAPGKEQHRGSKSSPQAATSSTSRRCLMGNCWSPRSLSRARSESPSSRCFVAGAGRSRRWLRASRAPSRFPRYSAPHLWKAAPARASPRELFSSATLRVSSIPSPEAG